MIIVFVYWCFLLWLFGIFGGITQRLFGTISHPVITLFLGMFSVTMIASAYSFFGGLGIYFECGLILASFLLAKRFNNETTLFFRSLTAKISRLTLFSKVLLIAIILLCALKSASIPFLIDNESYYLQTIRWLDEYGLIKGVANLHPFLMQFSGWHILQSATNLDNLQVPINDLSGFALVMGLFYSVEKANSFYLSKGISHLYAGYFMLFSVFMVQFITQPSPDVIVYTIALVIFYECYLLFKNNNLEFKKIAVLFILSVFAIFCKLTALILVLFPVTVYILRRCTLSRKRTIDYLAPLVLAIMAGALFLAKNHIISGYIAFPLKLSIGNPDWKISDSVITWYLEQTQLDAFQRQDVEFFDQRIFNRFRHWITLPGVDGIFNKAIIILLTLFPIVLLIKKWDRMLILLYILSLLQFFLIWNNAPQFRFFFPFFALLFTVGATLFLRKVRSVKIFSVCATILIAIPILIPLELGQLSSTTFLAKTEPFDWNHILIPHPNTRYVGLKHETIELGNTSIQTPVDAPFFWGTGDCDVPCVNKMQLEYFEKYFGVIPQQRSDELSEGFYAKQSGHE